MNITLNTHKKDKINVVKFPKYAAKEALEVIDGELAGELTIHRFDAKNRTKAHLFAVNGPLGQQFAIVLGNTDTNTGHHPALQTRILLERCQVPDLTGIELMTAPYNGSRVKTGSDCKIAAPNQTSLLIADESALKRLLRWYAGRG